jgi:large subunit ribosomal protein L31e
MMSKAEKEEETTAPPPAEESTDQAPVEEAETLAVEPVEVEKETTKSVPAAAEAEKEPGEEEIEVVEEKIYTIPIGRLGYATDRGHRSPKAVRDVRAYVARHMRADEVSISNEINQAIWGRGINKPPRKITVRAVKDKEGKVVVYPAKTA